MSDAAITLVIMACSIALFISNRLPVGVVAIFTALALYFTGIIDLETAFGGFGDPSIIFIASLFIVAAGLEISGITGWVGRVIADRTGENKIVLFTVVLLVTALLSALITPNGAAAAMIPVVLSVSRTSRIPAATLLMPVAFAASAGALLTLSGSVVNVMASQMAFDLTGEGFGFFEFAGAGVFLVIGTIIVTIVADRLIPTDREGSSFRDFGSHVETLIQHYNIEQGFFHLRLESQPQVPITGRSLSTEGADIYAVQALDGRNRGPDEPLQAGDLLLATGSQSKIRALAARRGFTITRQPLTKENAEELLAERAGVAEVIIPPRSSMIGQRVFTGMQRGSITVLGLKRGDLDIGTMHTRLREGDTLLFHGPWEAIRRLEDVDDVLLIDSPMDMRKQLIPLGKQAAAAGIITTLMVIALASGLLAPAVAGILAACFMVLAGVLTISEVYRAVSWQTVVLIGGLIPLSVAIRESGAADLIADLVLRISGSGGTRTVLAVIFLVTMLMGQFVSNTATALVMLPIVVAISAMSGIDPRVMLMSLAVASGASLLTPIATPANMMVAAVAGYKFSDYLRFGSVMMVVWFTVAVGIVPLIWG